MSEQVEVLLVGDGPVSTAAIERELAGSGLELVISRALSEPEMLAACGTGRLDLIIAIDNDETFDAVAALSVAREMAPLVPVIVIANASGEEVAVEALKAGATDYIIADRLTRLGPAAVRALHDAEAHGVVARADEAVRESEARFRGIFENAPTGIGIRRGRHLIYANPSYLAIHGYERLEDIPDQSVLSLIAPATLESGTATARARIEPTEGTFEDVGLRADGTTFPLEVQLSNVSLADGRATVTFLSDITERKNAQEELDRYSRDLERMVRARTDQLLEANEALQRATETRIRFLSSMGHELRVPLNSVIGFAGVLLQGLSGPLTDDQRKQIGMIYESGRQLIGTIDDVLDVARIEAGKEELHWEQFEIDTVLAGLADSARGDAAAKDTKIVTQITSPPVVIVSDRRKVAQILTHVLENAVKFTDAGRIDVVLERPDEHAVIVRVRDTGMGIAPEDLADVFEEFQQGRYPDGRRPEGSGLGLAICHKLAGLLGGSLTATSEPGKGSEFVLTLPVGPVVDLGGEL
ncbi:MAG: ATP-binding protein [Coriobacteriia bacterium]|nr:ATP-binding protein [Coriobacteriia bacterium]